MEKLSAHITALSAILHQKGYVGAFMTNMAYPDNPGNSLRRYFDAVARGEEDPERQGLSLYTYSKYNGEEEDSTTCYFKMCYNDANGFSPERLLVQRKNTHGVMQAEVDMPLNNWAELPDREAANDMVKLRTLKFRR